ncbi:MAG TPA: hypothetical protein VFJ02_26015 [Vicinamibacterales bacterium]|nr:hypothetical protein [Vicinamibacterales bacterium]
MFTSVIRRHVVVLIGAYFVTVALPHDARAQQPDAVQAAPWRIGVQGVGIAGVNWPGADESFAAAGLDKRPVEFGGGVRVSEIWRTLFVQVNATRWSGSAERVFVDESGTPYPLGIPLDVKASFIDVSAGWRFFPQSGSGIGRRTVSYVGAGVGIAKYSEESPFAQAGDDLHETTASYHVAAGFDVGLLSWLGIGADVRYRFIPDVLGDGGVSAVLGEKDFGGFQAGVSLRLGFNGAAPERREAEPVQSPREPVELNQPAARPSGSARSGSLIADAPAFLLPDATRTPLRVLASGTAVTILEESPGWMRVEFQDPQFGPRVGYIESKFVRR